MRVERQAEHQVAGLVEQHQEAALGAGQADGRIHDHAQGLVQVERRAQRVGNLIQRGQTGVLGRGNERSGFGHGYVSACGAECTSE
jgi:hypothetical protein